MPEKSAEMSPIDSYFLFARFKMSDNRTPEAPVPDACHPPARADCMNHIFAGQAVFLCNFALPVSQPCSVLHAACSSGPAAR